MRGTRSTAELARRARESARRLAPAAVAAALLSVALSPTPQGQNPAQSPAQNPGRNSSLFDEEEVPLRSFSIPLAREARRRAENAREHIAAERWGGAIVELQAIIDQHQGDLLPDDWRATASRPTQYPAYPGASGWATDLLGSLPEEARGIYEERFGARAREALEQARTRGDGRALTSVVRRWPLTRAARGAWWTLGDMELERGEAGAALFAWRRALDLVSLAGEDPPPGAQARRELAERLLGSVPSGTRPGVREEAMARDRITPGGPRRSIPRIDADAWSLELDLSPFQEERRGTNFHHNLHPVLAGDRVLVNTSWWMYCVDAFTGRLLWRAGPPEGWRDLPSAKLPDYAHRIDFERVSLHPAVSDGVVVGLMQTPFSRTPEAEWQGHDILARIPERRLFAFDLETGEELWNHAPRLDWDSDNSQWLIDDAKNSFAQRVTVAASPVIAGSRVLVPAYRVQGRIDYHVACYELATGRLLWSTNLIGGQRERNMFGNLDIEFVASRLTVVGDRVVAQSELGTVAALDLFTGQILWESEYHQIPLQPSHYSRRSPRRKPVWHVASPLVTDDLVIATPSDSDELVAFELEDGRVHWGHLQTHLSARDFSSRGVDLNLLVGVDRDTVYLTGRKATALQKAGGLRTRGDFLPRWTARLDGSRGVLLPTPRLTANALVIPLEEERLVLDRWTGESHRSLTGAWAFAEYGNAVIGDGALFTLGRTQLNGFFDWEVLLDRQRELLAASPDDAGIALESAALFVRRARGVIDRGETVRARSFLAEARKLLAPLVEAAGGAEAAVRHDRPSAEAMHSLLRLEATIQVDLADSAGALRSLAQARPLATTRTDLCDTLRQEERILRTASLPRRLEILAEIGESCGELPLPDDILAEGCGWLMGEAILSPKALEGWKEAPLDIGLWVLFTRADARARAHDGAGALRDLHDALARYGTIPINDSLLVGDLAGDRISRRLELDGRGIYREFEREAAALHARALGDDERDLLTEVLRLYPHSKVASEANRALLAWAWRRGETGTLARMLFGTGHRTGWHPEDLELGLFRLGLLLAEGGNHAFLRGLTLARPDGRRAMEAGASAEERGRIAAVMGAAAPTEDAATLSPPRFSHDLEFTAHHAGQHEFVGELADLDSPDPTARVQIYMLGKKSLSAFSSLDPGASPWTYEAPHGTDASRIAVTSSGVFLGSDDEIHTLDVHGNLRWKRTIFDAKVLTLDEHSGVLLAMLGEKNRPERIVAFDSHGGTPLWRIPLADPAGWLPPILGEDVAVFLVKPHIGSPRAVVIDLFAGVVRREFQLPRINSAPSCLQTSSWIEDGRLVVPSFRRYNKDRPFLTVHDLETGREDWRIRFGEGEELFAIVECEGENYPVTRCSSLGRRSESAGVYRIEIGLKSMRRVASLDIGETPIGIKKGRRTSLAAPYLFILPSSSSGNTTPVRAIHLPNGRRWVYHLPVPGEELHDAGMPMPAVSDDCAAIVWIRRNPRDHLPTAVNLELVDLAGGFRRERREVYSRFLRGERIEVRGLGEALLLFRQAGSIRGALDILEGDVR
jgi:outer membrane protein assembly factor BamB